MFIFLSKFLPLVVYPLGLAFVLLLVLVFTTRIKNWQRALLVLAILALGLGSNRWVAMSLARSLEWRYLPTAETPSAQVAVVLGGGTVSADYPRTSVEVNGAGDRVLFALQLYNQGKVDHLLLTGGFLGWDPRASTPAEDMAGLLQSLGVPGDALWLEPDSRNTFENAVFSAKILKEHNIQEVLLVTSAWHMQRSVKLFEAQGIEVIPVPVDYHVTQVEWGLMWGADWKTNLVNLLPSESSLSLTTLILKEYFGILIYEMRGWQ